MRGGTAWGMLVDKGKYGVVCWQHCVIHICALEAFGETCYTNRRYLYLYLLMHVHMAQSETKLNSFTPLNELAASDRLQNQWMSLSVYRTTWTQSSINLHRTGHQSRPPGDCFGENPQISYVSKIGSRNQSSPELTFNVKYIANGENIMLTQLSSHSIQPMSYRLPLWPLNLDDAELSYSSSQNFYTKYLLYLSLTSVVISGKIKLSDILHITLTNSNMKPSETMKITRYY